MTFQFNDKVVHAQRGLFEDRSGRVGTVLGVVKQKPTFCIVEFADTIETVPFSELELAGGTNGKTERL